MDTADKVFGSLVLMYIKKELRRSATTPVATMGISVGRANDVPGGILVVPIGYMYDGEVSRWVLDKPQIRSVDYRMYEGFPPLRTQLKVAGRTRTLKGFMESKFNHGSVMNTLARMATLRSQPSR